MSLEKAPAVVHYMTRSPHTIAVDATLKQAHELMQEFKIRHLPVLDGGELVGVVSQRDLYVIESLGGVKTSEIPISTAMTPRPYTISPSTKLDEVAAHLAAYKASAAVVLEDDVVIGIFTLQDALVALVHIWKETP